MTFTVDLLYVSTCQCVLAGHVSLCYIRHIAEAKPITGTSAVAAAAELTHTHTTHTARSLQSMLTKTRMSDWEMIRLFCMTPPFTELPFIFAFLCTAYFTGCSSEGKQGKLLLNNLSTTRRSGILKMDHIWMGLHVNIFPKSSYWLLILFLNWYETQTHLLGCWHRSH